MHGDFQTLSVTWRLPRVEWVLMVLHRTCAVTKWDVDSRLGHVNSRLGNIDRVNTHWRLHLAIMDSGMTHKDDTGGQTAAA